MSKQPNATELKAATFKFRAVWPIIRAAGLGYATAVFAVIFFAASGLIALVEPALTFGTAAWLCFQAITTIGFGDVITTTAIARVAVVVLSIFSIMYLAVITGVVVAYCTEMMKSRSDESIAQHLSDLENLDKLSPEELKALSAKIKRGYRRMD